MTNPFPAKRSVAHVLRLVPDLALLHLNPALVPDLALLHLTHAQLLVRDRDLVHLLKIRAVLALTTKRSVV